MHIGYESKTRLDDAKFDTESESGVTFPTKFPEVNGGLKFRFEKVKNSFSGHCLCFKRHVYLGFRFRNKLVTPKNDSNSQAISCHWRLIVNRTYCSVSVHILYIANGHCSDHPLQALTVHLFDLDSGRGLANDIEISKSSVHRILRRTSAVLRVQDLIGPKITEEHNNRRKHSRTGPSVFFERKDVWCREHQ